MGAPPPTGVLLPLGAPLPPLGGGGNAINLRFSYLKNEYGISHNSYQKENIIIGFIGFIGFDLPTAGRDSCNPCNPMITFLGDDF